MAHLRTQVDAFYNDYENFQVIVGYPTLPVFGFELNNPNPTKIYGFEAQVEAAIGGVLARRGHGLDPQSELGRVLRGRSARRRPAARAIRVTGPPARRVSTSKGAIRPMRRSFTFNLGMQYAFALAMAATC